MRVFGIGLVVWWIAWAAAGAEDKKDETQPKSPQQKFDALLREFSKRQHEVLSQLNQAKEPEREQIIQRYWALPGEFAPKFWKLAEDHPNDLVAGRAVFWILGNRSPRPEKSDNAFDMQRVMDKAVSLIREMSLANLANVLPFNSAMPTECLEAAYDRAVKEEKDEHAAELLAWVVRVGMGSPLAEKALARLVERYAEHPVIVRICSLLGEGFVPNSETMLRTILEKAKDPKIQSAATLSLGMALAEKVDRLADQPAEADRTAAEAEKHLTAVIEKLAGGDPRTKSQAEERLKLLRTLRVGKEAPEITGPDLDGQEFKLSDYRGKVILLDFWGHW